MISTNRKGIKDPFFTTETNKTPRYDNKCDHKCNRKYISWMFLINHYQQECLLIKCPKFHLY